MKRLMNASCTASDVPTVPPASPLGLVFLLLSVPFLFVGDPEDPLFKLIDPFWNLGHLVFFMVFTWVVIGRSAVLARLSLSRLFLVMTAITLGLGTAIELIQALVDRDASVHDVWRDLIGTLIALAFFNHHPLPVLTQRSLKVAATLLVLSELYSPVVYLVDQWIAMKQFPILADFETPFEANRWSRGTVDRHHADHGKASLRVELTPAQYSGTALERLVGNWQDYRALNLSVLNPTPEPLRLTLKIFDELHIAHGRPYPDRFNREYILVQGWNRISIPLEQVTHAPKRRLMNLGRIVELSLFTTTPLVAPRTIYVDYIRLTH